MVALSVMKWRISTYRNAWFVCVCVCVCVCVRSCIHTLYVCACMRVVVCMKIADTVNETIKPMTFLWDQIINLITFLSPFPILFCSSCLACSSAFWMSSMWGEWAWCPWCWWCPCGERCLTRGCVELCPSLAWSCVFVEELVLALLLLGWLWLRLLDPDTLPAMTIRDIKTRANTPSKCSRFNAGIQ